MMREDLAFPPPFEGPIRGLRGISGVTLPAPPARPVHAQNILGLDLGTNTGWAIRQRDGMIRHGTVKHNNRKRDHVGQRWLNFRAWLFGVLSAEQIHLLAYEDVRRHEGITAAHAYGAFKAMVEMCAASCNIELLPVGVGVIKKAWTGRGNATKQEMIKEAQRRWFDPRNDNEADALAILHWAAAQDEA